MKRTIRKTYKTYKSIKRYFADPENREAAKEIVQDVTGFVGMFALLFSLAVMF